MAAGRQVGRFETNVLKRNAWGRDGGWRRTCFSGWRSGWALLLYGRVCEVHDVGVVRLRGRWLGRVSRRAGEGGVRELGVLGGGLRDVSSVEYIVVATVCSGLISVQRWS